MKAVALLSLVLGATLALGRPFTGPENWQMVQTNAVRTWQARVDAAGLSAGSGIAVDRKRGVLRLLAEAVGHNRGTTAEFLLIAPLSDRAYEAFGVTVARPSEIVRAMESLGIRRGAGVGSRPFRFWPVGEPVTVSIRRLDRTPAKDEPLSSFIEDGQKASSLSEPGRFIFTGGSWEGERCLTDNRMPAPVFSLYNERLTLFDLPVQAAKSAVYGRLTVRTALPSGTLFELVVRPDRAPDGKPRVLPLVVRAYKRGNAFFWKVGKEGEKALFDLPVREGLDRLRALAREGRDLYVGADLDESLTLSEATGISRILVLLDGKGIKLDGRREGGLYPGAFFPQEKWRTRKDRLPQPFELHLERDREGKVTRKLVFIEEDWSGEGLDPKLTPREYPFGAWSEFLPLVKRVAGPKNKVHMLFIFAPADLPLREIMPGVRASADYLPLVYLFQS